MREEGLTRTFVQTLNVTIEAYEATPLRLLDHFKLPEQFNFWIPSDLLIAIIDSRSAVMMGYIRYADDTLADMAAVMEGFDTGGGQCYTRFIPTKYCTPIDNDRD